MSLAQGGHAVLESMEPFAMESSPGNWAPIDLSLSEVGGGFQVANPAVGVSIPKPLQDGVSLANSGVSLTPVDASGAAAGGSEGRVDGSVVFYGGVGVGSDVDEIVKPETDGFSEDAILRSQASPEKLMYRVGLPEGASLTQKGSGAVEVMDAGQPIATILAPRASDAEGTSVPVSVSVSSGDVVVLSVDHPAGQYKMPIAVDPTVIDKEMKPGKSGGYGENINWVFGTDDSSVFELSAEYDNALIYDGYFKEVPTEKYGELVYETQGESHIYEMTGKTKQEDPTAIQSVLYIKSPGGGHEGTEVVLPRTGESSPTVCAVSSCEAGTVTSTDKNNDAFFIVSSVESTSSAYFNNRLSDAAVSIVQEKGPLTKFDTTEATVEGKANAAYPQWVNATSSSSALLALTAFDPGIGINGFSLSSPNKEGWGIKSWRIGCAGAQCTECYENECPTKVHGKPWTMSFESLGKNFGLGSLPEGKDTVEEKVEDAVGLTATASTEVKVDNAPPHNIELLGLPAGNVIGDGTYHFTAKATDGEGTTPSSGVKSIVVSIDGRRLSEEPSASCPSGPCTASGEWAINGEEFGAGQNTLTITATDNAGNVVEKTFTLLVRYASPVTVGPGAVAPGSGQFTVAGPGVSLGSGLTFSSHYHSRNVAGAVGPFGPEWASSFAGQQSIVKQSNGNMVLVGASGAKTIFPKITGGFESPAGDPNLALSEGEPEGVKELVLTNATASTSTSFRVPTGGSSEIWVPSVEKGAPPSEKVTYSSETVTVEGQLITRPTWMLGTIPAGVTCPTTKELKELKAGCRALLFKYAKETKATGENESEWNEYNGRLKEVVFIGYNTTTKAMQEVPVTKYLYDKQGRLRAEWDPRISPALKTIYGYDGENHLTALTPPGQETWAFTYGTIPGDSSTGRLLKVTRAPASAGLWKGEAPKNTEAPKLSGPMVTGYTLRAPTGVWGNEPVVYAYQWEDCNTEGKECTPIAGATNPGHMLTGSDVGHTVVAQVTATNGGGSVSVSTPASASVTPSFTEYALPKESYSIYPYAITPGPDGNLWYTDFNSGKIGKITTSGTITAEYPLPKDSGPLGITQGPDGNLWFADYATSKIGKITTSGTITEYELPKGSGPLGITQVPGEGLWFTDAESNKIGKITTSGSITEYELPKGSEPRDITLGSDGNLWFTENGTAKIGKITTAGAIIQYELPKGSEPYGIAAGPEGSLWFTDNGTGEIGRVTTSGSITEYALPKESYPLGVITPDPDGNIWYIDSNTSQKIGKIILNPAEGEHGSPQPGSAIEYNVPVSGAGAPYAMGSKEVEEGWAQKDAPTEAMAIFSADEPQGWPATNYKRATIYYQDKEGHMVNAASPSGGISTSEYNENGDVTRSLTPDNRAAALKEGAKSAEVSKLLSTENSYSSKGTELTLTVGPRHLVRLANGKEVQARGHTVYSYDEGAPTEGGPYRLVTKVTQGAQIEGEGEKDVRTTDMSYSGQSNLGWKLRKPTSVTGGPSVLKITHTTLYEEASGNVIETRMPKGTGAESPTTPSSCTTARRRTPPTLDAENTRNGRTSCARRSRRNSRKQRVCRRCPSRR